MKIGLVAGSARKRVYTRLPAKELYASPLFRLSRAYVERACDGWYVLSTYHGLLHPNRITSPVDDALAPMGSPFCFFWTRWILAHLARWNDGRHAWLILAGQAYRDRLAPYLRGPIEMPLAGLAIGQQLAWLKRELGEDVVHERP